MGWPTERLLKLIELFKRAPCLWDPLNRHYKKSVIKNRAWQTISTTLGYNAIETKKKMQSLLASYRRERKKHELDPYHMTQWFAYEPLSFLNNRSFVKKTQREHNDPLCEIIQQGKSPSHDSYESKRSKVNIEEAEALSLVSDREKESSHYCYNNKNTLERNKRDASDIFGEYVATKHRKYCEHVQNVIEHQIAQILFDADMGAYNPGTTSTIRVSARAPIIENEAEQLEDD